jgi:hypothetical protein
LIIQAIDTEGGVASFDQIYDRVSKKFDSIKRRDGTPYTSECRRAIQASLSNNPVTRPFFKKETKKGTIYWSLAKRSVCDFVDNCNNLKVEFLAEYRQNDSEEPKQPEAEVDRQMDEAEDQQNESEEADEEIHDEELEDEEDTTKAKTEKEEEDKQKEDTKEEKHLYANRVKRARKIKENAGKRTGASSPSSSSETKTDKELRFKKRRR